jgi:hypothetical protein
MTENQTQDKIIALFADLPIHRQKALLAELQQILELGIEEQDDDA